MNQVKFFCQRFADWCNQRLGTQNGINIGGYGCAISCIASAESTCGGNWTPADADNVFTDNGGYLSADGAHRSPWISEDGQNGCDLIDWGKINELCPNINHVGADYCKDSPAPVGKLCDWLRTGNNLAILEVRWAGNENAMHFVLAYQADEYGNIYVMDPANGDSVTVQSGRYGFDGDPARAIYAVHYIVDKTEPVQVAPAPVPQEQQTPLPADTTTPVAPVETPVEKPAETPVAPVAPETPSTPPVLPPVPEPKTPSAEANKTIVRTGAIGVTSDGIVEAVQWYLGQFHIVMPTSVLLTSIGALFFAGLWLDKYIKENPNIKWHGIFGF